jgi:hypothetical protein
MRSLEKFALSVKSISRENTSGSAAFKFSELYHCLVNQFSTALSNLDKKFGVLENLLEVKLEPFLVGTGEVHQFHINDCQWGQTLYDE